MSELNRIHLMIAGKMNAGKSTLCNLLTQQESSIVDATPGTTADTKISLMEIHGLGPVKIFDTAGIDENGQLGEKKRHKVWDCLKSCDLLLIVINARTADFSWENQLLDQAALLGKRVVLCLNKFDGKEVSLPEALQKRHNLPQISLDARQAEERQNLLQFITENIAKGPVEVPLLPFVETGKFYILVIPMDNETPEGRLLRPQALALEYITRHFAFPVCYRLDLAKARSADSAVRAEEQARWQTFCKQLAGHTGGVIIDSQSIDVMAQWIPQETILTTFSIMMIQQQSHGGLRHFVNGQAALSSLNAGDRVLIYEACNHSRIGEDIGTVKIPKMLEQKVPGIIIEHAFGRQLSDVDDLKDIKLIIHCGGCMLSSQVLLARLKDLDALHIPYTNYGVFLSARLGLEVLQRVVTPFIGSVP